MATEYTINMINASTAGNTFWCFLNAPVATPTSQVYGNSSTNIYIEANAGSNTNAFIVPLQFMVAAGNSNHAVGLNTRVISSAQDKANLGDVWGANYFTLPPKQGPNLALSTPGGTGASTISIVNNAFNPAINAQQSWFENQTFGIQTEDGFVGLTWAPQPSQTTVIRPEFTFYVATGNYAENALADIDTFSNGQASITLSDFSAQNQVWVTLKADGTWGVASTGPAITKKRKAVATAA